MTETAFFILLALLRSIHFISTSGVAALLALVSLSRADAPVPGAVSPATSVALGGTANVHLSATGSTNRPAWARFASGPGTALFLGAGTLLPLVEDGKDGGQHSLRAADSLLSATLVTEALKHIVREKRPDSDEHDSFPSEHATAAFAVATMQAHFHPNQAIFWYAGATAIAASRVKLRRHYTRDVLAGAAIGIVTSQLEIRQSRGLLFFPFIHGSKRSRVAGLSLGGSF